MIPRLLATALALIPTALFAAEGQGPILANVAAREQMSLNGKWHYHTDWYETGSAGFRPFGEDIQAADKSDRVEYDFDTADTLWVPGDWNSQKPELLYYEGTIWYRKKFDRPDWDGGRIYLYFDAASRHAQVFLNGEKIGEHEGGFTPFSFEVTGKLKDSGNSLVVGVSNRRKPDVIPGMVTDWWNYGGITRDVRLVHLPSEYVQNFNVGLSKDGGNAVIASVRLNGSDAGETVQLVIPELEVNIDAIADANGIATFKVDAGAKLQLWTPENPKLYDVTISAGADSVNDRIGFRKIETRGTDILLNGKPIFLRGVSLHEENPLRGGRAFSEDDARLLLGWAKEMNCNFVRLAHYPHNEHMARLADEMGILLWEEQPLYWGIDWANPDTLQRAKDQFSELIARDHNRASVIIWSIANETGNAPDRNHFLREVAAHVRALDNTRLLSAALKKHADNEGEKFDHYIVNDPIAEILDIVSLNDYIGWYQGLPDEAGKKSYEIVFDKPVVISEFGGGAIEGLRGDKYTRWSEDYQRWLYDENLKMFSRVDKIRGLSPWILVDFRSPLRQLPHVQDGWNRKGLISETGARKLAFYLMQRFYGLIQKEGATTLDALPPERLSE